MSFRICRGSRLGAGPRFSAVVLVVALSMLVRPVGAFVPKDVFAIGTTALSIIQFSAEGTLSHPTITDIALRTLYQAFFGISTLNGTHARVIDQIATANTEVDEDQYTSAKHFDGENFSDPPPPMARKSGQTILTELLGDVIVALQRGNGDMARVRLGMALHTIQDFYSHTNWVELGNTGPSPDVGRGVRIPSLPPNVRTCTGCIACVNCDDNITTDRLTSGYYSGEDVPKPDGKCSHGGPTDNTTFFSGGINKDTTTCSFSPHFPLHTQAATIAALASAQFINDIRTRVTLPELRLLFNVRSSLAIVIDTNQQMAPFLAQIKTEIANRVSALAGTPHEPTQYILAAYNNAGQTGMISTSSAAVFLTALNGLTAGGASDCSDPSMQAIFNAVSASQRGGTVYVYTNSGASDVNLTGNVASLAVAKLVQVFIVLTGTCSTTNASYSSVATKSGGQFYALESAETSAAAQLIDATFNTETVDILSIEDTLTGSPNAYTFPVDSTVTSVDISVSGNTGFTVRRPDGSTVLPTDPDVTFTPLSSGGFLQINRPPVGEWTMTLNGNGQFSLLVSGQSTLTFRSFEFVDPAGHPGHEGVLPIAGQPLAGEPGLLVARMGDGFNTAVFDLRDKTGQVLQALDLTQGPDPVTDTFFGTIDLPTGGFLPHVTGQNQAGEDYQRLLPELITPSSIAITRPPNRLLRPGQTATFVFQIRNLGEMDAFDVSAKDLQNFITAVTPTRFNLAANQLVDVTVTVRVPAAAEPGTADPISLFVQNRASSNSATVEAFVTTVAAQGGQPVLFGSIAAKGAVAPEVSFVDVKLTNTGSGDGRVIKINQLQFRTLAGAGDVTYNVTLAPVLPRPVPDLDIGDSSSVRLYLNVPETVTKFSITETGTVRDISGALYNFSIAQVIYQ